MGTILLVRGNDLMESLKVRQGKIRLDQSRLGLDKTILPEEVFARVSAVHDDEHAAT